LGKRKAKRDTKSKNPMYYAIIKPSVTSMRVWPGVDEELIVVRIGRHAKGRAGVVAGMPRGGR
jgi:hypothetical protein